MNWIKTIGSGVLILAIGYLAVSFVRTRNDNKRLKANVSQLTTEKLDMATTLEATNKEMAHFLNVRFPALEAKLDSAKIRTRTIEKIIVQKVYYRDTSIQKTDLRPLVEAIQNKTKLTLPFEDVTECLVVRGHVEYNGEKLDLKITDREFSSINEVVSHWNRKKWKLFGLIPTRLFGKREIKVTVFNSCGESKTVIINKKR